MKFSRKIIGLLVLLTVVLSSLPTGDFALAAVGVNRQIPFSGTLNNSSGSPLTGTYDMVFRIYDASSGGSTLWTGTHSAANSNPVSVDDGFFSVLLGSGSGNTLSLDFNDDTYYLGITIESDSEMTPRTRMGATGYAFNADTLDGYDVGSFALQGGTATFTAATATDAVVTSNFTISGTLTDGAASVGTSGYVLQTTGSGVQWVATSSLGITGGGSSLFTDGGATTYLIATGDNLAVGTTSANAKLTVAGEINIDDPSSGISVMGNRVFYASSTSNSISFGRFTGPASEGVDVRNIAIGPYSMQYATTSRFTTAIGDVAGQYASGDFNVLIGSFAGDNNKGDYNVLVGESVGGNVTGDYNIYLGSTAGYDADGDNNIALGWSAGGEMDGNENISLGLVSGYSFSGNRNMALGYRSVDGTTVSGSRNIFVGHEIEPASSTASNRLNIGNIIFGTGVDGTGTTLSSGNIGIGTSSPNAKLTVAGDINIDDPNNGYSIEGNRVLYASSTNDGVFVGDRSGSVVNSSSLYLTALGVGSLEFLTSSYGANSTAVGYLAGQNVASTSFASNGTYLGSNAGRNSRGSNNTIVGWEAGRDQSGGQATIIGTRAGYNNAGGDVVAIGSVAGYDNTGYGMNFMGVGAGQNIIGGEESIFVGNYSGNSANTATYTVAVGHYTLSGGNTQNNVALGYEAGTNVDTGADNNIFLGFRAADSLTTGSNNLIIGYDVEAPSNTGSNQLNIGNVIFGTGLTATGTDIAFAANIGIGTTSPIHTFTVDGDLHATGLFYDSVNNSAGLGGYVMQSTGTGFEWVATSTLGINPSLWTENGDDVYYDTGLVGVNDTTPDFGVEVATTTGIGYLAVSSVAAADGDIFVVDENGDVGIGITNPLDKLHVAGGNILINNTQSIRARNNAGTANTIVAYDSSNDLQIGTGIGGNIIINGKTTQQFRIDGVEYMRLDADGDFGLDDTTPDFKLEIAGTSTAGYFGITAPSGTDGEILTVLEGGNVGIGTSTPTAQLHTTGSVRFSNFGSGSLQTDANGNVSVSSDVRLKDVQSQFATGLEAVLEIDPIQYKWLEETGYDTEGLYTGFSAQNIKLVLPEAVGEDKNGFLTLSDRPILAALINAVKDIWETVSGNQNKIDELESRIEELEAKNNISFTSKNDDEDEEEDPVVDPTEDGGDSGVEVIDESVAEEDEEDTSGDESGDSEVIEEDSVAESTEEEEVIEEEEVDEATEVDNTEEEVIEEEVAEDPVEEEEIIEEEAEEDKVEEPEVVEEITEEETVEVS